MSAEQPGGDHPATELEGTAKGHGKDPSRRTVDPANTMERPKYPAENSNPGKLSGAELKKKAKEEKAARRAKEKQEKSIPSQGAVSTVSIDKEQGKPRDTAPPAQKSQASESKQHKRTGSTGGNQNKQLPIRQPEQQAASAPQSVKKDNKRVAFFSHLYGSPRRTSIAGAGKDVHPAVLNLGIRMSNYVTCGSNARCVGMLLAFKKVIEAYTTPPGNSLPRHLTSHLSPQIDYLVSCRPLSVSMGNAIRWLKVKISEVDPDTPESTAKADLCESIDNFITERITIADQVIATSTAEKIQDGDVILVYANSSSVRLTLEEAHRRRVRFRVLVIDSRPMFEGKGLASGLADLGLTVQYSLLHGLSHHIKDVTKVVLGAHAMMSNGRLYSRAGTALVAMMAKEANVPVVVCCESLKFSERVALDSIAINELAPPDEMLLPDDVNSPLGGWQDITNLQLLNPMYDLTPADYIDMVITEYGSLPPSSVPVVHALSTAG